MLPTASVCDAVIGTRPLTSPAKLEVETPVQTNTNTPSQPLSTPHFFRISTPSFEFEAWNGDSEAIETTDNAAVNKLIGAPKITPRSHSRSNPPDMWAATREVSSHPPQPQLKAPKQEESLLGSHGDISVDDIVDTLPEVVTDTARGGGNVLQGHFGGYNRTFIQDDRTPTIDVPVGHFALPSANSAPAPSPENPSNEALPSLFVEENSMETLNHLALNALNDGRVRARLAINALNVSLKQSNVSGVEEACKKLADLAQNKCDAEQIKNFDGVKCIIKALYTHKNEAGVQEQACRALSQFADHWPHVCKMWSEALH